MIKLALAVMIVLGIMSKIELGPKIKEINQGPPTYEKDIKPIFKTRCSECHNYMPGKNWQKYEDAYSDRLNIKIKMLTKEMPQGKDMPQEERNLIVDWVNGGAVR
jgi:uncharacterized membrane protein